MASVIAELIDYINSIHAEALWVRVWVSELGSAIGFLYALTNTSNDLFVPDFTANLIL